MNVRTVMSGPVDPIGSRGFQAAFESVPENPAVYDTQVQDASGNWHNVDANSCGRIICGFMTQAEAGFDFLYACSRAGYVGAAAGCADPWCEPYQQTGDCEGEGMREPLPEYNPPPGWDAIPFPHTPIAEDPVQSLTPPFPSIVPPIQPAPILGPSWPEQCGFRSWVDGHKVLAAGLVLAAYVAVSR